MNRPIWFGSEEALFEHRELLKKVIADHGTLAVRLGYDENEDGPENPVGFEVRGGIGIITTQGSTISRTTGYSRYYGRASYDDITERFAEAADNSEVKVIVHHIDSTGGEAARVKPLAEFISKISSKVKPVVSFTDSVMTSAALWYGTAAKQVIADEDATLGSLGAILVHLEFTEQMAKEGVKPTVFRSAPFKALGGPYEKLTDEAKTQIKTNLAEIHDRFVSAISDQRSLGDAHVRSNIANGKTFNAQRSRELGLVDNVMSFDQLVAKLTRLVDNPRKP